MASSDDIALVRSYTNEQTDDKFSDAILDGLITSDGVVGAAAKVWDQKAAEAAELVNVSEAGASHAFSDLHKQALTMAKYYRDLVRAEEEDAGVSSGGRVRVRKIVRS